MPACRSHREQRVSFHSRAAARLLMEDPMLELTNTINAMVDQLNGFISEVTRVARVEHVMTNFSAALRFTPNGGDVTVAVRGGDDHDTVDVSVADTRMGIHPTDIDSIFGRFYRTRIAVDTAIKGSGLGLAIAKRMIEAQNGKIRVTSRLGHGSTFTVTLRSRIASSRPSDGRQ